MAPAQAGAPAAAACMDTPLGPLTAVAGKRGLTTLFFGECRSGQVESELLTATRVQLGEYFAGERREFELALAPAGTPFQRRVWEALARVPFGATTSYRDLADTLGVPGAARAVGRANALNPLVIVIPCHRVIGAHGALTGYGGGIERKRALLELEAGRTPGPP
jgi:methylated-DNA-[protein]-cysteine S-methyltransferase